jgi:hypothetical protein
MILKALVRLSPLSCLNESQSYLEKQCGKQHLWDFNLHFNNLQKIRLQHELNETSISCPQNSHATYNIH